MSKKWDKVRSPNQAINFASKNGAEIHENGNKVKISVPTKGSMVIWRSEKTMDGRFKNRVAEMFKILGLLLILFMLIVPLVDLFFSFFGYTVVWF